jgi:hypothetical protein
LKRGHRGTFELAADADDENVEPTGTAVSVAPRSVQKCAAIFVGIVVHVLTLIELALRSRTIAAPII